MAGYFDLKATAGFRFMFNLMAGNHDVILTSQPYDTRQSAEAGIVSVQANSANEERYLRKIAADKSPYFVLVAENGEIIGKSEMYSSAAAMEGGITSVKTNGPGAPTKAASTP